MTTRDPLVPVRIAWAFGGAPAIAWRESFRTAQRHVVLSVVDAHDPDRAHVGPGIGGR